ncbi:MAG: AAA family ATPase [Pseudomonadota bacterium]|nr:AAA family ATPase [Pseudomonadota bacterium]
MTHPRLVAAMSDPGFYPHRPGEVELAQTHISYVFIAGDEVYKVKKAVDFGFLDFTTLEKRRHYCHEELRLNRRLAPETYLEVAAIREEGRDGRLVLGAADDAGGRVVDYAVRMRRLPTERMLKRLVAARDFDPEVFTRIADRLVAFHRQAETGGRIDALGSPATIRRNHEENFAQTEKYIGRTIPDFQFRFVSDYVFRFMEDNAALLDRRVRGHRIRDGHGDLHLEHIVVDREIVIFDCIEFNERFRYGDVAAEAAFLAMDLDYNGHEGLADRFVKDYARLSGDEELLGLIDFYKCYYAYVRGKVVSFRLDDPAIDAGGKEEARRLAARYFDLAYTYAARLEQPTLILVTGLMGTGKSVLASLAGPRLGAMVIRADVLRKELLNLAPTDRHHVEFGQGIYGEGISEQTYAAAHERAAALLRAGRSVIIDASYKRARWRGEALALARRLGVSFLLVECVCPDEVVRERLERRARDPREASDGRWEIYAAQKDDYDRDDDLPEGSRLTVDSSLPPETCLHRILVRLRS